MAELGYGNDEIRSVMDSVDDGEPVEEMVRTALRQLARNR